MKGSPAFIGEVVSALDLAVTSAHQHSWRVEPREAVLAWFCDLDDDTSTSSDNDPASFVRGVCPALRLRLTTTGTGVPPLNVPRTGPQSDLARMVARLGHLLSRGSDSADGTAEDRFVCTDPHGVLDASLRRRSEHWPPAVHGDGAVRPAELWSVQVTAEGLVVESVSWWDSAPALRHHIGLARDIADRLAAAI